jgi:hypothetical protein
MGSIGRPSGLIHASGSSVQPTPTSNTISTKQARIAFSVTLVAGRREPIKAGALRENRHNRDERDGNERKSQNIQCVRFELPAAEHVWTR